MKKLKAIFNSLLTNRCKLKDKYLHGYEFKCGHYVWGVTFNNDNIEIRRDSMRISHILNIYTGGSTIGFSSSNVIKCSTVKRGLVGQITTTNELVEVDYISTGPILGHKAVYTRNIIDIELNHLTLSGKNHQYDLLKLDLLTPKEFTNFLKVLDLGWLSPQFELGLLTETNVKLATTLLDKAGWLLNKRITKEIKTLIDAKIIKLHYAGRCRNDVLAGDLYDDYLNASMSAYDVMSAKLKYDRYVEHGLWPYTY